MASKVALDSIRSLTFYNGEFTKARRTSPIPQLKCIGKPCNVFQPDVVRCINDGGRGLDVEWKAYLPEQLRFGRVEVSCEGWSRPGDPTVLKGSCGLEYRLLRIPSAYTNSDDVPGPFHRLMPNDPYEAIFMFVWGLVLLAVLYYFLKSCFGSRTRAGSTTPASPRTRPGGDPRGGWFGYGSGPSGGDAPPPYTPPPRHKPSSSWPGFGWQPGFWSGLGLGTVTATLWNSQRPNNAPPVVPQRSMWDWERPTRWWETTPVQQAAPATTSDGWFGSGRTGTPRRTWTNEDRGEGASNLGRMRSSTGYGGSTVR
ncbi:hypothetical protein BU17DRAFT_55037 [Hysterangium stoloniferum]|nr:hypothetical protein BU17DRAFT_55037 [Hysterangium stoloniferum]